MIRYPDLPEVWVHAPRMTPRLEAALDWTIGAVLGLSWHFESDREKHRAGETPWKFQYGGEPGAGYWVQPDGLLDGAEMRWTAPEPHPEADWLALIFWMGSRMEEWGPGARRDEHGRFDPTGSFSEQKGWLNRPVCEEWAFAWGERVMKEQWPAHLHRLRSEYSVRPTLDVDSAFAFKGKGWWRTSAALGRDLMMGDWKRALARAQTCSGNKADVYDTYAQTAHWHDAHGAEPQWFFLLSRFGRYDKGLPPGSPPLADLMRSLEERNPGSVQWHPGYAAASDASRMQEECSAYTAIMGRPPKAARQHYLRMIPGQTRRQLISLGIQEDHTEGHAVRTGFRGGFSRSRKWYDLEEERLTDLILCPFAAMDATLCRYMKVPPEQASAHLAALADSVKEVGGTLRLLWHNESLAEQGEWLDWGGVYPNVLKAVH